MVEHIPVMAATVIEKLDIKPSGFYVDCTFGRGGHSRLILERLGPDGRLLVIDKDKVAIAEAEKLATSDLHQRLIVRHGSFKDLFSFCEELDVVGKVDGVLLDLGVSSPQLDNPERGFSFLRDGPLDMRMDKTQNLTAADWLASASEEEIAKVLWEYGEEKFSRRIARAICEERKVKPITTTLQLADLISSKTPKKEKFKHQATRSFQAIRIFVNSELSDLKILLEDLLKLLSINGRIAIISFHSLEDRIVKQFIKEHSRGDIYPRRLPIKDVLVKPRLQKVGKFFSASENEIKENIRARSAKLRVAMKVNE